MAVAPAWDHVGMRTPTIEDAAARLAALLTDAGGGLSDPERHDLVFEPSIELRPLARSGWPCDVWAVDGGQAVVADARSVQVAVTRASRVRWQGGGCVLEEEGELHPHLLGCGEERLALAAVDLPVGPDAAIDLNLLRDWAEWEAVGRSVDEADPGGLVLVDGDLLPDWRLPRSVVSRLLDVAERRDVGLAAVTKHSSLAHGGAPLLGRLERQGERQFGPRAMWWARVAATRPGRGPDLQILAARLDPDARFAFRVDLPASVEPEVALGSLSSLCDDAAFPGYPYPLSVADRLAACPLWLRDDVRAQLEDGFDRAGVPLDVRERAFADRHRLMERA
jgi:hypothetical protein